MVKDQSGYVKTYDEELAQYQIAYLLKIEYNKRLLVTPLRQIAVKAGQMLLMSLLHQILRIVEDQYALAKELHSAKMEIHVHEYSLDHARLMHSKKV
jgi:hypothetical protein